MTDKSRTLSPGRALRPDGVVTVNADQEAALKGTTMNQTINEIEVNGPQGSEIFRLPVGEDWGL